MGKSQRQQKRNREAGVLDALLQAAQEAVVAAEGNPDGPALDIPAAVLKVAHPFATTDAATGEAVLSLDALRRLCVEGLGIEAVDLDEGNLRRIADKCTNSNVASRGKGAAIDDSQAVSLRNLCWLTSMHANATDVRSRRIAEGQGGSVDPNAPALVYYREGAGLEWRDKDSESSTGEDWEAFVEALGTPLPMSLRVHRSQPPLEQLARKTLKAASNINTTLMPIDATGQCGTAEAYGCPHAAYHDEKTVEHTCRTLHSGTAVSFQEVVSMLPVAALGIEPHHRVMEMCAAPGSKSLQALDAMYQSNGSLDGVSRLDPKAVMIVNEKDNAKATQTLPARIKRYHAPHAVVTKCDGTQLPTMVDERTNVKVAFDRIICDVPCSGDGTVRKERSVLATWTPEYAASLVRVQKSLLRRGFDMLAPGGILVYSTCSLNPAEDEEVVLGLLDAFPETAEILDVNARLKDAGVSISSHGGTLVTERLVAPAKAGTELPPRDPKLCKAVQEGVLRVFAHKNDTGGFFVACIRKRPDVAPKAPPPGPAKLNQWTGGKRWRAVNPADDANWANICNFYGLNPLNSGIHPVYHVTPQGAAKRIVGVTEGVRDLVLGHVKLHKGPGVELVSMGIRLFELYDGTYLEEAKCRWRISQGGSAWLAARCSKRKLLLDVQSTPSWVLENGKTPNEASGVSGNSADAQILLPLLLNGSVPADAPTLADALKGSPNADLFDDEAGLAKVGPVLVGVRHSMFAAENGSNVGEMWLSATHNGRKLELTVDISVRALLLWSLYGVELKG